MLNKITLEGKLGCDPEIEMTQDGRQIARFPLATSYSWQDQAKEWHKHTDWHRIVVFRESTVKWIKDVLKKGDTVKVEGSLTYRRWKDKQWKTHCTTSIIVTGQNGKVERPPSRVLKTQETADIPGVDTNPQSIDFEEANSDDLPFESPNEPFQIPQFFQQS